METTNNKVPRVELDNMDGFEILDTFFDKLPQHEQERLNYMLKHDDEYNDHEYWDELYRVVYKYFAE